MNGYEKSEHVSVEELSIAATPGPGDKLNVVLVFKSGATLRITRVSVAKYTVSEGFGPKECSGYVFSRGGINVLRVFIGGVSEGQIKGSTTLEPYKIDHVVEAIYLDE